MFENDWTLFRLHRKYSISFTEQLKKKLFQQFVKSFKIFQKIENLASKLKILVHWQIHSIFIIVQLKSVLFSKTNFYERQKTRPLPVHVDDDTDFVKNFVLKKIVDFRQSVREKKYFVKWKNYDSEKNVWRNFFEMKNALNLIRKYEEKNPNSPQIRFKKIMISNSSFFSDFKKRKRSRPKKILEWNSMMRTSCIFSFETDC